MTLEKIEEIIPIIEQDITYFGNLGFEHLKAKFNRDLDAIKSLFALVKKEE